MRLLGLIDLTSASMTFVADKVVVWGARTFVLMQSNPFTFAISCVALVAIGTAVYIFRRLKASESTVQFLFNKIRTSEDKLEFLVLKIHQLEQVTEQFESVKCDFDYLDDLLETSLENLKTFKRECLEKFQTTFLKEIGDMNNHVKNLEETYKLTVKRLEALENVQKAPKETASRLSNLNVKLLNKVLKSEITRPFRPFENKKGKVLTREPEKHNPLTKKRALEQNKMDLIKA